MSMFSSDTFKDYKNQKSWGRITGTVCYAVSILISVFGLLVFFASSHKEQLPTILGYCEVMAAQFLGAGALLYGSSKATEAIAVSKSDKIATSIAIASGTTDSPIVNKIANTGIALLEKVDPQNTSDTPDTTSISE